MKCVWSIVTSRVESGSCRGRSISISTAQRKPSSSFSKYLAYAFPNIEILTHLCFPNQSAHKYVIDSASIDHVLPVKAKNELENKSLQRRSKGSEDG